MRSGQQKSQLVAEGRLAGSGPGGAYDPQLLSLGCTCQLVSGGCSTSAVACDTPSNLHGSNRYDRATGRLEIVVGSHMTETLVEVRTMPVVAVSLTLSTSIDDFYRNKAAFLSSLAFVLGIDPRRITIVDVVAGSRNSGEGGRRLLTTGAAVSLEIAPDPVVGFAQVRAKPPTVTLICKRKWTKSKMEWPASNSHTARVRAVTAATVSMICAFECQASNYESCICCTSYPQQIPALHSLLTHV
jgi:hypothetical protein